MKNKYFFSSIVVIILFLIVFYLINKTEFLVYNYYNNLYLNNIINLVIEKYPNVDKEEIVDILSSDNLSYQTVLDEYGIDLNNDSLVLKNEFIIKSSIIVNVIYFTFLAIVLMILYLIYIKKQNKKLNNITSYLQTINQGNYRLEIDTNTEDELSILKNEIYKITVMLKEQANISKKDKLQLKTSLEDLSHQLKTPLTSISIMLDNISDINIDDNIKKDFIKDMKREVLNISFLINNLLKLSKFDANTIEFHNKKIYLNDLVLESFKNISMLANLKNIKLINIGNKNNQIVGDFKWQVEALTNILKNCIEYSDINSKIEVLHEENKLYSKVIIKDYGKGIASDELKHILERFYKGKNSSSDSVGIGLSLAKTIIEKGNGYITCNSKLNIGTTFIIKYLK